MQEISLKSGYKAEITISDAIMHIENGTFLLPAIQRKFVWSSEQIEVLFDSIMRDYPINSFMLWHVTNDDIKNSYTFYRFLHKYRARFHHTNTEVPTVGYPDFFAIIDGQQRLNSLYIGLKGSYAYKMPRKWWIDDEDSLPTRHLYLDLTSELEKDNERKMVYNFQFLTQSEYETKSATKDIFKVQNIYTLYDEKKLDDYLDTHSWRNSTFARATLRKLRRVIFEVPLINYYQEENQNIDTVLDIFIRVNSGGAPLSFSNLLMSITTAYWNRDAREEFDNLVKQIFAKGFVISEDLILKCWLVISDSDIKFKVSNFNKDSVEKLDKNWDRVRKCFIVTFELLSRWSFNDSSLKAKNAIIPIVYYIYHNHLEDEILKDHIDSCVTARQQIRRWLRISLLKGIFGGQSDSVLAGIRSVMAENLSNGNHDFPYDKIKEKFAGNDAKSLSLSEEVIENILTTQKEDSDCYAILALLYAHLHYDSVKYHMDHLHPASAFDKLEQGTMSDELYAFYKSPENWNSILNLQLLEGTSNESKNADSLKSWIEERHISLATQLIPEDVSLEFDAFPEFIAKRKELLIKRIKEIIG